MYDKESIQNDLMVVEYPIQELESQIQLPKATPNPVSAEKSEETSSSPSVIDVPTTSIPAKRQRRRTISLSTKKVDEIVSLDAIEEKDSGILTSFRLLIILSRYRIAYRSIESKY